MRFGNLWSLYLLILFPIFLILIASANYFLQKRISNFAEKKFFNHILNSFSLTKFKLKMFLLALSLFFLIFSLALPRWDKEEKEIEKKGIDIAICLDVSQSMLAKDISPSRLERAKAQVSMFLDILEQDRVALIPFSGRSFVQCPLTDDYQTLKMFLSIINTNSIQEPGTNIADALQKANELFNDKQKSKIIILITDGEELQSNAIEKAEELAKNGVKIYSLGIGTISGSPIAIENENRELKYIKNEEGNIVLSKLNANLLIQLSKISKGKFYNISPNQSEIHEILKEISSLEKDSFQTKKVEKYKEQYFYFTFFSLLFLIIEFFIPYHKKENIKRYL